MTDENTSKTLSEVASAVIAKRRVSVRRKTAESLNKRIGGARLEEAVIQARKEMAEQFDEVQEIRKQEHLVALAEVKEEWQAVGVKQGQELERQDYDSKLDESVNNRLCDNARDIPWPVGVMIAGEQHRILQALADSEGNEVALRFARVLGIIHAPVYLDAPSSVTHRNCEQPPKHIDKDQRGKQIQLEEGEAKLPGYTEHWKYYLRQIDESTD